MDFLGRKILSSQGQLLAPWLTQMQQFVASAAVPEAQRQAFEQALEHLRAATAWVLERAKTDPAVVGNCAVAYLHLAGLVAYGYMWLRMSAAAEGRDGDFYREKQQMAAFYCQHLLPQSLALQGQILGADNPWAVGFNSVER